MCKFWEEAVDFLAKLLVGTFFLLHKVVAAIFFISSEQVYSVESYLSIYFDGNF